MNSAELWAEIEADQAWRLDEIRFFQNRLSDLDSEDEKSQFRRALILILYAHFEGFFKFALAHYIRAINQIDLTCREAQPALAAATMADVFRDLRNPNSKCPEFRNTLPEDAKLHRFARDKEFVERFESFEQRRVNIADDVIDIESNLTPPVIRKNLYYLGFPSDKFAAFEGHVNKLLAYRNPIAHGETRKGIKAEDYEALRDAAYEIMHAIKRDIMQAIETREYLRLKLALRDAAS
jgi:hypothetical protein